MLEGIIFIAKGVILTEALTHAVRSWGIFDTVRYRLTQRSNFLRRLLLCFECTSVWIAVGAMLYLYFLDFKPLTLIIIFQRLAVYINISINYIDALRASTINKI